MKATLLYWHKARLHGRYVLEMEIHRVERSAAYRDGIKYGLILVDSRTGRRVLMDNHHPKGPHIHVHEQQFPYRYVDEETLIRDFKDMVRKILGVKL